MSRSSPASLRRLAGVLLALAVVPALAFAAAQVFVQSESEARLAELRDEQLDGLLFSVNQNAWDVATGWADRLSWVRAEGVPWEISAEAADDFFAAVPAVSAVFVADTALAAASVYEPGARLGLDTDQAQAVSDRAAQAWMDFVQRDVPDGLVRALVEQREAGYRKLEPVTLSSGRLGLVFVASGARGDADGPPRVLCMVIQPEPFVEMVVAPKLREVALGGVELGVFAGGAPMLSVGGALTPDRVERERPLWLLPGHTVGARVGEGSAEALMRRRLVQTLLLLGGVTLVLAGGAYAAWRGVRREVEVARLREGFVSNVSHELRTPLALIRMYAEALALGRVPEPKRQRYYNTLVAETERLSRLVGNVLAFSRSERGEARLDLRRQALGPVVREVAERYGAVVERAGGTLCAEVAPDLPAVAADRDAVAEALVNLVDNAVKYGGPGPVELAAAPHGGGPLGPGVALSVSDRGPGLAAADRERVFEPFVRVQAESADGLAHTAKGTGLGLALVRRIADAHGGAVEALPRDGGGLTVRLTLPAAPGDADHV